MAEGRTVRALGLCSGGLDSILSALVLRDQGIDVQWVCFETPFFSTRSYGHLILSGVFHRFPKLKYILTESGCSWAPSMTASKPP